MTVYANIPLKPAVWLSLPSSYQPDEPTPASWAAGYAADCWKDSGQEFDPDEVSRLTAVLTRLAVSFGPGTVHPEHEFDPQMEIQTLLHLPDPRKLPVPIRVMVFHADIVRSEQLTLRNLAQVVDPEAIDEPEITEFPHPRLGEGLRAFRHRNTVPGTCPSTGVFAVLKYAFSIPGHEDLLLVSLSWPDLARVAEARDDIDDLVRSIDFEYHPDPPQGAPTNSPIDT